MKEKTIQLLLVEDDRNFSDVLKSYLEMNDYDVTLANDGQAGLEAFKKNKFDLCIFDVMMPKMDGFQLAKEVRTRNTSVPIIFLTAKNMQEDIVEGLKIGADDYMTKPFNSEELLLRIQAILKRASKSESLMLVDEDEYALGHFTFNYPLRRLVYSDEKGNHKESKLSPKEAHLLKMFCQYKNKVLPRSEALEKIWGEDNYFTARSMDVFVTKLRKYLSIDKSLEIVNIHGNGFRLVDQMEVEV